MPDVMLSLGTEYQFSIDSAAYDALLRRTEYRWAEMRRIAHRPSLQFVGIGSDDIDLRGRIFTAYKGGLTQLDSMREQAATGAPLHLVSGYGAVLGRFCIVEIEEEQSVFAQYGAPRKVSFRMRLRRYGEDDETTGSSAKVSTTASATKTLTTVDRT